MTELKMRVPTPAQGMTMPFGVMLPHFPAVSPVSTVWLVGAHGGAGVSTLAKLGDRFADANKRWPQGPNANCVVVARTSAHGLLAARSVLSQWAAGGAGSARLIGLILIDDAPGRLPRPLRDLARVVAGGAPQTWRIAWNQAWRCGEPVSNDGPSTPPATQRIIAELLNIAAAASQPQGHD